MARSRSTIPVNYIVERGNYFLAHSEDEQRDERKGVASMIELALHKAGAYAGYLHLESAGIDHDGWHAAWDRIHGHVVLDEINGPSNAIPRWEDYCQDDTRRAYMMKGQPYPNTRVEKVAI